MYIMISAIIIHQKKTELLQSMMGPGLHFKLLLLFNTDNHEKHITEDETEKKHKQNMSECSFCFKPPKQNKMLDLS